MVFLIDYSALSVFPSSLFVFEKNKNNMLFLFDCYLLYCSYLIYNGKYVTECYANFLGHLPEFSLGIYLALYEKELPFLYDRRKNFYLASSSALIIIGAQFFESFFILSYTASCVFTFSLFYTLNWRENKFLEFTGKISPYLFGFNGFLFRHYLIFEVKNSDNALLKLYFCTVWLIANYVVATIAYQILNQKTTSAISKF